jgi:hypothetical protein
MSLVALPGRQQCHQSHGRLSTERIAAVIGHTAAYAGLPLVTLPPRQRCHWSFCRLLSAAAGDIAAGIVTGNGEEGLLGQADPAVLQLLFVNALAGRLAGSSRARCHLNKRGFSSYKNQCSGSVSFFGLPAPDPCIKKQNESNT